MAIYETHSGGEFDATNILDEPVVTGITPIGMEHVKVLGPTIGDITWHKAGIFKFRRPAISVPQVQASAEVLRRRAEEKQAPLRFVEIDQSIPSNLRPETLRLNCSLALALVATFLGHKAAAQHRLLIDRDRSIEQYYWPGRYQCIANAGTEWFLDGAHSEFTMPQTIDWFAAASSTKGRYDLIMMFVTCVDTYRSTAQALIFSHITRDDGVKVLRSMHRSLEMHSMRILYIVFTTYDEKISGSPSVGANFSAMLALAKN